MANLKIALTGPIACGKSSVSGILHKMGAFIISLDALSREVVQPDTAALAALVSAFSDDILNADTTLNRAKLRQYLLKNKANQKLIESILHPLIFKRMHAEINKLKDRLIVIEIPRPDPKNMLNFDRAIIVKCDQKKQLERLIERENIDKKQAKKQVEMQANQNNIAQFMPVDVLENNANIERLTQKTQNLYAKLINL